MTNSVSNSPTPQPLPPVPSDLKSKVLQRLDHQHDRIQQGIRSGQLTEDEAKTLIEEQKALRQKVEEFKSDGVITKDERKELREAFKTASRNIFELKHNDEARPGAKSPGQAAGNAGTVVDSVA